MTTKKRKPGPEFDEVFTIGKTTFAIVGDEGDIRVYRLHRDRWQIIEACETYSFAHSLVVRELAHPLGTWAQFHERGAK